jgi:small subunit ribosomal protein S17
VEKSKVIKKTLIGKVISDKMAQTITVEVETRKMNPIYKKFVRTHKKFKAHDAANSAKEGDVVKISEARPVSKDKRWKLVEIIEKAQRG